MIRKIMIALFGLSLLSVGCAQAPEAHKESDNASLETPHTGFNDINAFSENPARWKLISDLNGVRVYQDLEAIPGRIGLRGKEIVNAPIAKVATAFTDVDARKKWLNILVENRILRSNSDFARVEYEKLKSAWPYQFVDFVYQMTFSVIREPKTLLIRMASINDDSIPVPADTVRGQMTGSYDFVREIDSAHSELVMEMGLDPKGALPSWDSQTQVIAWFNQTMQALRTTVEDPKFKVSDGVQGYITKYKL